MKKILALALALVMLLGLAACAASEEKPAATPEQTAADAPAAEETPAAADGKTYTIGVAMEDLNTQFWLSNYQAMKDRAAELGNVTLVEAIAGGDANLQNQQILDFIAQGVDAIICAPKDNAAIATAVEECNEAGIPIIMDNRPVVEGSCEPDAQVLSDNRSMAYEEMKWFIERAKADGKSYKCLMLIGNLGDGNAVERRDGYQAAVDEFGQGVVDIVVSVPTEWDHEVALSGLQSALAAYPDIDMMILPSDFLWEPVQTALTEAGKWAKKGEENHVVCISFDGDETGKQMLADGYCWADAAQSAALQGTTCVDTAIKLADGETLDSRDVKDSGLLVTFENFDEVKDLF